MEVTRKRGNFLCQPSHINGNKVYTLYTGYSIFVTLWRLYTRVELEPRGLTVCIKVPKNVHSRSQVFFQLISRAQEEDIVTAMNDRKESKRQSTTTYCETI